MTPLDLSWFRLARSRQELNSGASSKQIKNKKCIRTEGSRQILLCSVLTDWGVKSTRRGGRGMSGCCMGSLDMLGMGPNESTKTKLKSKSFPKWREGLELVALGCDQ